MWFSQKCCRLLAVSSGMFRCVIRWVFPEFRRKVVDSDYFEAPETIRPRREGHVREDINPHGIHLSKNLQLSSHTTLFLHSKRHKYFLRVSTALVSRGFLIVEVSRSYSDTSHSVELLWMSDRSVAETSTWQHKTITTDRHPCPRRDSNP
jgi:hypothetical protein